jgi:aminopeptidase N
VRHQLTRRAAPEAAEQVEAAVVGAMKDKYDELVKAFNDNRLGEATRSELERYLTLVCLPGFKKQFNDDRWKEIPDNIRILLQVRIAEELHRDATLVARRAYRVAIFALWIVIAQMILTFPGTIVGIAEIWGWLRPPPHIGLSE